MTSLKYKMYSQGHIMRNWELLLDMTLTDVQALEQEWKETSDYNDKVRTEIYQRTRAEIDETIAFLKAKGIEVERYSKRGKCLGYQKWFETKVVDVIKAKYPSMKPNYPYAGITSQVIKDIEIYNNCSPTGLVDLHQKVNAQYEQKKRKADQQNKLLIASIKYATEHDIDIEGMSNEDIINTVNSQAKEEYKEKYLPEGTEIYLKHECEDCDTYIIGEYRCSCGNRRIEITIEGNILEGFSYYPEGC